MRGVASKTQRGCIFQESKKILAMCVMLFFVRQDRRIGLATRLACRSRLWDRIVGPGALVQTCCHMSDVECGF